MAPRRNNGVHPRREMPLYNLVNSGMEAALYRHAPNNKIHKFWRQDWILSRYRFFKNGKRVYKNAGRKSARMFDSDLVTAATVEKKGIAHHGIPIEEFRKITLVLSTTTEDIIRQAKAVGIPVPSRVKAVPHKTKPLYIVEFTNLSKPGCKIISAAYLPDMAAQIKNSGKLLQLIEQDKGKLKELGYHEDLLHPQHSAWLIRYNERTGIGERFLWDVTNLRTI